MVVRNGDAHLKNFGILYDDESRWFAPLFDVVTTTIYPYERDGVQVTDRTMALRLVSQGSRGYPLAEEFVTFGREHCEMSDPREKIAAITSAMHETLAVAPRDSRVPRSTLRAMKLEWEESVQRFS